MEKLVQLQLDLAWGEIQLPTKREEEVLDAVAILLLQIVKSEAVEEVDDELKH